MDAQRTDSWFQSRLGKVTASRISDVIAKTKTGVSTSRYNYLIQLVSERLTGKKGDSVFINKAMEDGIEREEVARTLYTLKHGDVDEVGFIDHPTIAMSGASPDGALHGVNGGIEIKSPIETTHTTTLMNQSIPTKYIPQMQWQMACAGYDFVDFISYNPNFPDHLQLFVKRLDRDDDYIRQLESEVSAFLAEVEQQILKLKEL
jgi:putative phage-type endonuclease